MAVVLGNLALTMDVAPARSILSERKGRTVAIESGLSLNLPRRSENQGLSAFIAGKGFDSEGDGRSQRVVARGKANSKVNGVDPDAGSSDGENGNGSEEWDEDFDWEKEMRRRVKEIEERRELEKKAEELQSQLEDGEGDGGDETEEQKRMRVRKELEKVGPFFFIFVDNLKFG